VRSAEGYQQLVRFAQSKGLDAKQLPQLANEKLHNAVQTVSAKVYTGSVDVWVRNQDTAPLWDEKSVGLQNKSWR
jgi:hypothetical protein